MIVYKKGGVSSPSGDARTEAGKAAQAKHDSTETARRDSASAARYDAMFQEGTQGWKPKSKNAFPNGPEKNLNLYKTPNIYETKQDGGNIARPVLQEEKAKIFQAIGTAPGKSDAEIRDKIARIHREFGSNGVRLAPLQSKRINRI